MSAVVPSATYDVARVSPAAEDYLKAVYELQAASGEGTIHGLARAVGVSDPSATNMVKRLHELGLLSHARYHGVTLTAKGEQVALSVIRRHRLLECYLVEALGYRWDQVHAEADRLEHHVSEQFAARIDALLGYPTHDPHGDPIPSVDGTMPTDTSECLTNLAPGRRAIVSRISDRDPDHLRYLGDQGIYPGVAVIVREPLPSEGPIRVEVNGTEHSIGRPHAAAVRADIRGGGAGDEAPSGFALTTRRHGSIGCQ